MSGWSLGSLTIAQLPQGYLTSPALCPGGWGGSPTSGKGSALRPVPAWGAGVRCLCILARWSSCWGGCACQEGVSNWLYCRDGFELCLLMVSVFLSLYCGSVPVAESEERALCCLMGVKTEENTAWWVHVGQNPAVGSASAMASSCTKPLAGLRIQGFFLPSSKDFSLELLLFWLLCAGSKSKPFSYGLMEFLPLVTMAKLARHCDWAFQHWSSSYTMQLRVTVCTCEFYCTKKSKSFLYTYCLIIRVILITTIYCSALLYLWTLSRSLGSPYELSIPDLVLFLFGNPVYEMLSIC